MGNKFLGVGWKFPFVIENGKVATSRPKDTDDSTVEDDLDMILGSVDQILNTKLRERFFNREFGSGLHELPFRRNNSEIRAFLTDFALLAISEFEPRVSNAFFDTQIDGSILLASEDLELAQTNSRQNQVYPFKLKNRGTV